MPIKKLKELLDNQNIKYISIVHSPAYTAQDIAQAAHISGKKIAKTVIVKVDNQLVMIVVPANMNVNFQHLEKELGKNNIELACENDFRDKFPDCEIGAIPPVGALFGMPVYICDHLTENQITFSAGSYSELIQLDYKDYEKLVKPKVIHI